jgi:hypothetical protein
MSSETATGVLIATEKSKSWLELLSGKIPGEVTVYLILWKDRSSGRFVDYGFYLSTSEPGPMDTDPQIACEIPVPVVDSSGKGRNAEDLRASLVIAAQLLARKFVLDPSHRQLFEKFSDDSRHRARKVPTEVLDPRDYDELLRKMKGDWEDRQRERAGTEPV